MPKERKNKKRNYLAKELWTPLFKQRIIPNKKKQEEKRLARKKVECDNE